MLALLIISAFILCVCAVCAAILYPRMCKKLEDHRKTRPDYSSQPELFDDWLELYHALDRKRTHTALFVIASYLLGMIILIAFDMGSGDIDKTIPRVLIILFSVALIVIGLRSAIYNDRVKHYHH